MKYNATRQYFCNMRGNEMFWESELGTDSAVNMVYDFEPDP